MKTIAEDLASATALALVRSVEFKPSCKDPIVALHSYPWNLGQGQNTTDQKTLAKLNLELDGRSCLGRVAQAAAFVELRFPNAKVGYAEVLSDNLRRDMLAQVHEKLPNDPALRTEWLQEVLLYEEPHAVVLVDGVQFDPLSTVYPEEICHPKIQSFPTWGAIAASIVVAQAWLEDDPNEKLDILQEAETLCPGTTLVSENMVSAMILLEREDEAIPILKELLLRRPCARTLFSLWLITRNDHYRQLIDVEYTPYMMEILKKEGGFPNG